MANGDHEALVTLEILDAFGARPTRSHILEAFHELTRAVSLMRQRATRPGVALEENPGEGNHLAFMGGLIADGLDLCLPDEQAAMTIHLDKTRAWLARHGFQA